MRQSHLNSAQMERMLTETAKEGLLRHVEECAECHAEVAALRNAFGDLKASAMALATVERRLAQPPVQVWWRVRTPAWVAVAVVLAALVVPAAMHPGGQKPKAPAIPVVAVALSDEALLSGIQNDLEASVPAPLAPLETTSVAIENDPTR
jgi:anti-sigma factor RsiW